MIILSIVFGLGLFIAAGYLYMSGSSRCKCGGEMQQTFRDKEWCSECRQGN